MGIKKIVGVFAYPDDEIRILGLLLRAQSMGIKTHIIFTSYNKVRYDDGEIVIDENLAEDFHNNSSNNLKISGFSSVHYLDALNKNKITLDNNYFEKKLNSLLKKINPDVVITYEKDQLKAPVINNSVCEITTRVFNKINESKTKKLYHMTSFPRNFIEKYIDELHYPRALKSKIMEYLSRPDDEVNTLLELNNEELSIKLKKIEDHILKYKDEKELCQGLPFSIYKKLIIYECLSINDLCKNISYENFIQNRKLFY